MDVLQVAGFALSGVAASSCLIVRRASAEIKRIRAQAEQEISHWKAEAVRSRISAAQLKSEFDAWRAGHAQGRSDVINALPLLAVRHEPVIHDPALCGCQPAAHSSNGA
ncbi:MAG TPA: hypothetical protein VN840_01015 [Streptosporangiaceae bacterium]|nr:hypothetical protein [Streptosporangiaceae bacterium]